jgi:hypothetical protein
MKFLIALALAMTTLSDFAYCQASKLQEISVTIDSGRGHGSGTLFNRKVDGEVVTYVWTAAHVIDNLRKTRTVIVDGSPKTVVEFGDAKLVQEFRQNGRRIGESRMEARVVRYSDAERGEDLALLEVRKHNFVPYEVTARFYLDEEIPDVGTRLSHVGSLLGQVGANSYTEGVVSQIGRVIEDLGANGVVFDQTTVTAFPGSSGGGVYKADDGRYVGMLVRGAGEQFNFIVPIRRMRAWAKQADVEWALDPSVKMPSDDALKNLPIEDVGFKSECNSTCKEFPVLLHRQKSALDILRGAVK